MRVGIAPTTGYSRLDATSRRRLRIRLLLVRRAVRARGAAEGIVVHVTTVDVRVAGHVTPAVQTRGGRPRLVRVLRQLAGADGFPEHVGRLHAGRADGVPALVVEAAIVLRGRWEGRHGGVVAAPAVLNGRSGDGGLGSYVVRVGVVRAPPRWSGGGVDVHDTVPEKGGGDEVERKLCGSGKVCVCVGGAGGGGGD